MGSVIHRKLGNVSVPLAVTFLIGAIGGMMSGGILGMFIGATFLAAGYQVFMKWVEIENEGQALAVTQQSEDNKTNSND